MRVVIQRVSSADVKIAGTTVGAVGRGLLVLLGVAAGDTPEDGDWLAQKIAKLRIFPDPEGHMNLSLLDLLTSDPTLFNFNSPLQLPAPPAAALVISQFTLIASTRKGNRPSFNDAAKPDLARPLYETFLTQLATALGRPVARGEFGADMQVSLINDGPVTILIDSRTRE